MGNKFKSFISKLFVLFILLCVAAVGYYFREFLIGSLGKFSSYYYIALADRSFKKQDYQASIEYYKKALEINPNNSKAGCNLGNILVMYENYPGAVDSYKQALKRNRNDIVCRMNLGIILAEELVNYDEAIAEYTKVLNAQTPVISIPYFYANKKTARENKGLTYYNMGLAYRGKSMLHGEKTRKAKADLIKAVEMYKKAQKILKKDYNTQYNLALTYHLLGDYKEAKRSYCKAIRIAPLNYEAHYNLAILLRNQKNYHASLDEFEKAGLLLDLSGDANISRYVYDVMNDVFQRIILTENSSQYLIERSEQSFNQKRGVTYIKGKLVIADEFDKDMLKNFKTCSIGDKIK